MKLRLESKIFPFSHRIYHETGSCMSSHTMQSKSAEDQYEIGFCAWQEFNKTTLFVLEIMKIMEYST